MAAPGSAEQFKADGNDTVYFSSDSTDLTSEAQQALVAQARWLQQYQNHTVTIEGHAPDEWLPGLAERGHHVAAAPPYDSGFGHAHAIVIDSDGFRAGAADPRAMVGTAAGI